MRMRALVVWVGLVSMAPALALAAGVQTGSESSASDEAEVQSAYMKVALAREGSTFAHPGYLVAVDEAGVFIIEVAGKSHEVSVSVERLGEEQLTLNVVYRIDGHQQLEEVVQSKPGEDVKITHGKTTLTVNVDPQGSPDTSRGDGDQIDGPKHDKDDPLGGLD